MKKNICKFLFYVSVLFFPCYAYGENGSGDEWPAGKIEFTDKNMHEGIVILASPDRKFFLNKNTLLFIKRNNQRIVLKITDIEGKYIRCIVNNNNKSVEIQHSEDVYYSEILNGNMKYTDVRKILSELIKLYENFILKVESTEDTLLLSEEVNKFSRALEKLIPEIKRLNGKYPELKKFEKSPPPELQGESDVLRLIEPRLRDAFFKIKMFNSDEKVKKAADELQRVLKTMATE